MNKCIKCGKQLGSGDINGICSECRGQTFYSTASQKEMTPKEAFNVGDVVTYTLLGATAKIVDIKPCYLLEGYNYYVTEDKIKKVKPLKKITKEQLADMGYEVGE